MCKAKFKSKIILDGSLQENTTLASENEIILRRLVCAGVELMDGSYEGLVRRIEFRNGVLRFYSATEGGEEVKV